MEINNWLTGSKIALGGDSEVRANNGEIIKKWNLPIEQVRLYQQITNHCSKELFHFNRFNISILPISKVLKRGPLVFSSSRQVVGRTVNTIDMHEKKMLGDYFQNQLNYELYEISGATGINVITWNAMLLEDNCSVVVTDIASNVRAVSL